MGYSANSGKPFEKASKSSHTHIINDEYVNSFIAECILPPVSVEIADGDFNSFQVEGTSLPLNHLVAFDGGYTDVAVRKEYPTATFAFFQFGALYFSTKDLEEVSKEVFIDPDDIAKLKKIQRLKLALPTKNITTKNGGSFVNSFRLTLNSFFEKQLEDGLETLKWFLFEEYKKVPVSDWKLASCPHCQKPTALNLASIEEDYSSTCGHCNGNLFLVDAFRLHEVIDEELGASGVLGYLVTAIEQLFIVSFVKILVENNPKLLEEMLFVKDGPLAYFGQTANLHNPMLSLVNFLFENHAFQAVGIEKSGPFVEHALQIGHTLKPNTYIIPSNTYIYKYILPRPSSATIYGSSTYYGVKIIYKSPDEKIYVLTLPVKKITGTTKPNEVPNLERILSSVAKLKCDMYENALFPIALANKLVSLSDHPSAKLLQKFATKGMKA